MNEAPGIGVGRLRQGRIYREGVLGRRPAVPTDAVALERRARRASSARAWAYVAGGAGEGRTMARNRAAFDRWSIVPRVAHGQAERDLSLELLGRHLEAPVLLAPVGAAGLVRRGSDLAIARAAVATRTPYVLSNQASVAMEECAAAMGDAPHWFQLYWSKDEALVDSLIQRAEASGAAALVVTLDTTVLGWRPQDLNLGSLPFSRGIGIAQYTGDQRFREIVRGRIKAARRVEPNEVTLGALRSWVDIARNHPGGFRDNLRSPEPRAAVETFLDVYSNPGLSWDHLATLRERTHLPVVLKGVLHPDDARRALDLGVDALVVSNHGGRQVDNAIASLDALVGVRAAIGPHPTVLLDSGVRTGADVFVAMALGADAVMLGRAYMYGLAIAGQRGVEEVVRNVVAELDLTMALCGTPDLASITRDVLVAERAIPQPEPTQPEPTQPEPAQPEPTQPEPAGVAEPRGAAEAGTTASTWSGPPSREAYQPDHAPISSEHAEQPDSDVSRHPMRTQHGSFHPSPRARALVDLALLAASVVAVVVLVTLLTSR